MKFVTGLADGQDRCCHREGHDFSRADKPALRRASAPAVRSTDYWPLTTAFSPHHRNCRRNQIYQCEWQEKLPPEGHKLVVTEARQRSAHPDIEKQERENFCAEPEHGQ